eukprot:1753111-Alexandrium_andersonii.AAC.1
MGLWMRWSTNPTAARPSVASPGSAASHAAAPAPSSIQAAISASHPPAVGGAASASIDRSRSHSASGCQRACCTAFSQPPSSSTASFSHWSLAASRAAGA